MLNKNKEIIKKVILIFGISICVIVVLTIGLVSYIAKNGLKNKFAGNLPVNFSSEEISNEERKIHLYDNGRDLYIDSENNLALLNRQAGRDVKYICLDDKNSDYDILDIKVIGEQVIILAKVKDKKDWGFKHNESIFKHKKGEEKYAYLITEFSETNTLLGSCKISFNNENADLSSVYVYQEKYYISYPDSKSDKYNFFYFNYGDSHSKAGEREGKVLFQTDNVLTNIYASEELLVFDTLSSKTGEIESYSINQKLIDNKTFTKNDFKKF
uniref:hypothetical protein n=1 Tax=uncultured Clostridium sp. TaxID=59620 RepID=UPI002611DEB5